MSSYLNFGNKGFQQALQSEIYVDKTGLVEFLNKRLDTEQRCLCVRPSEAFWQVDGSEDADSIIKEDCKELQLVGISYDRKTKRHECQIEKYVR